MATEAEVAETLNWRMKDPNGGEPHESSDRSALILCKLAYGIDIATAILCRCNAEDRIIEP